MNALGRRGIQRIDLVAELRTKILLGDILGVHGQTALRQRLSAAEYASPLLVHVDLVSAAALDYKFTTTCFFTILDDIATMPNGIAFVVTCKAWDREAVLRGACWRRGDPAPHPLEQTAQHIEQHGRHFVLGIQSQSGEEPKFEYVGTNEPDLIDILSYIDGRPESTIDELKTTFNCATEDMSDKMKTLKARRHVIRLNLGAGPEHAYISIPRLLMNRDIP